MISISRNHHKYSTSGSFPVHFRLQKLRYSLPLIKHNFIWSDILGMVTSSFKISYREPLFTYSDSLNWVLISIIWLIWRLTLTIMAAFGRVYFKKRWYNLMALIWRKFHQLQPMKFFVPEFFVPEMYFVFRIKEPRRSGYS